MNRQQVETVKVNVAISQETAELLRQARYVFGNTAGFTVDQAVAQWSKRSGLSAALARKMGALQEGVAVIEGPNGDEIPVVAPGGLPASSDPDVARAVETLVGEALLSRSLESLAAKKE